MYLVLNECAVDAHASLETARKAADEVAGLLAAVHRVRGDIWLTCSSLRSFRFSAGLTLSSWAEEPRNREKWQLILASSTKAPDDFHTLVQALGVDEIDYQLEGSSLESWQLVGLGLSSALGSPVLTPPVSAIWERDFVALNFERIEDDEVVHGTDNLPNVWSHPSLLTHMPLLQKAVISATSGSEVWGVRSEEFPLLDFLDRVEDDLSSLDQKWVVPVLARLRQLQSATNSWDTSAHPEPTWLSHVTGESESRRDKCWFDEGAALGLFETHARFTPGPGRIHFRVDRDAGRLTVAYIGPKIL